MNIQSFSNITFEQALEAWNRGFEGYALNVSMDLDRLLTRMVYDGKFPGYSFVALEENRPVGFVLNAIREINGKKIAWNGGTGIIPEKRGEGIGKQLIEQSLEKYKELGVQTAYLEAIRSNENAIKLYEKMGYTLIDHLDFLEGGELSESDFQYGDSELTVKEQPWGKVQALSFVEKDIPWQNRVENIPDARAFVVYRQEQAVGYFVSRKIYDGQGDLQAVVLHQLGADEQDENFEDIVTFALKQIFQPEIGKCQRLISNFPNKKERILNIIKNKGFETKIQQVHMKIEL